MKRVRRQLLLLVAIVALLLACSSGGDEATWGEGSEREQWTLVFNGHGTATSEHGAVVLEPRRASSPDTTHAGLAVTTQTFGPELDFAITAHTVEQIREGDPNPWEVAWVLWNYQDPEHFYAVVLKPHGWEISKQDPEYPGNQRFLLSGTAPSFPIGHDYRVEVSQSGSTMTVAVDGVELGSFTDTERPYTDGAIGVYTEDALVRFTDLIVGEPNHVAPESTP